MNLNQIKDIIQKEGGKIVIVENDEPTMIIMSFEEYRLRSARESGLVSKTPEISESRTSEPALPASSDPSQQRQEGLTIDDLPV